MESSFVKEDVESLKAKINSLSADAKPLWGTMSAAKMLAHCNVTYDLVFDPPNSKPNPILRFFLKLFVKNAVVSGTAYKKNLKTAPYFIINDDKDFEEEKSKIIEYLDKTMNLGSEYFEGKESYSFGVLRASEWDVMFVKHLRHHLAQFGL